MRARAGLHREPGTVEVLGRDGGVAGTGIVGAAFLAGSVFSLDADLTALSIVLGAIGLIGWVVGFVAHGRVRALTAGGGALSASAAAALIGHVTTSTAPRPGPEAVALPDHLTARGREVLELIVEGMDNQQIAARLFVSPFTVKTHVNRAMTKTHVRDRAQLVSLAVRAGLGP